MNYTRDFLISEFASPDGLVPDLRMDREFMDRLQVLRDMWNEPIIISSGIRSPEHNIAVGGVLKSNHLYGLAADIDISEYHAADKWEILRRIFNLSFPGIGISSDHIHLDMRPGHDALWTY